MNIKHRIIFKALKVIYKMKCYITPFNLYRKVSYVTGIHEYNAGGYEDFIC